MLIDRARVIAPRGVIDGYVLVRDTRIVAVDAGAPPRRFRNELVLDLDGAWLAPGFVDLQVNGAAGVDITTDPSRLGEVAAVLVRSGVTSFLPTVVTAPRRERDEAIRHCALRSSCVSRDATVLGVHLEGPMLSPSRAGAHSLADLELPSPKLVEGWSADAGVALVTLAPELPGAAAIIRLLRQRGVVVSIGHTDCNAREFHAARVAGATFVTHLFNAMRPFAHRDPGPVGATLADPEVVAGLIADGVHVDPVAVEMAFRTLGPERLVLVSDAVAPIGTAMTGGSLGGGGITVASGRATAAGGQLAGSVVSLDCGLRNLVAWAGCDVPAAVKTVTSTPARVLGRKDVGVIGVGARADLTVLDDDLRVASTIVGGEIVWKS
ncbi:MAG: N-acetylglucosamine-6-phosphate deacetylase [Acidimicrobiia bacterium]